MDDVYKDIYSGLYEAIAPRTNEPREINLYSNQYQYQERTPITDSQLIRTMIDTAEVQVFRERPEPSKRLRPDAKLFLLINFLQMVVLPVSLSERRRKVDFERILFADIVSLMERARDETTESEVSSHAMLSAVAKNWKKLKLSEIKLWED